MPEKFVFVVKVFLIGFSIFAAMIFACAGCNYDHDRAVNSFSRWTKQLGIEYTRYSCQYTDSEPKNGYITCQYIEKKSGEEREVECNCDWLNDYRETGGCRHPKTTIVNEIHNHNHNSR